MTIRSRIRSLNRALAPRRRRTTRARTGTRPRTGRRGGGVGIRARLGRFRIGAGAGRR